MVPNTLEDDQRVPIKEAPQLGTCVYPMWATIHPHSICKVQTHTKKDFCREKKTLAKRDKWLEIFQIFLYF